MNGETNKYINFARLAEERYGFNALHPRLAAQRERLARIAAAGAALEKGSGSGSAEEMSVDLSEGESNVEMGGTEGGCAVEGKKPVKKKQKADQYDKEDPFVDDSELLWEEQAAASKDGFFVYSGPLVPEGEKPTIERYGSKSTSPHSDITDTSPSGRMVLSSAAVAEEERQLPEEPPPTGEQLQPQQIPQQEGQPRHESQELPRPLGRSWSKKRSTGRKWQSWPQSQVLTLGSKSRALCDLQVSVGVCAENVNMYRLISFIFRLHESPCCCVSQCPYPGVRITCLSRQMFSGQGNSVREYGVCHSVDA